MKVGRRTIFVVFLVLVSATAQVEMAQLKPRPEVVFSCIENRGRTNDLDEFRAVIFVKDAARWRQINLPRANYTFAGWEYAGSSKSKPQLWAIAQFGRAGLGPDLEIAYSGNDGRTWRHLHSLVKISRFAVFESFSMASNGRGSLTIRLQDNPEPEHRDGYYTYTTTNNGRSWNKNPAYSQTAPTAPANASLEPLPLSESTSEGRCFDPRSPRR